jgi:exonuclease VII small subunit
LIEKSRRIKMGKKYFDTKEGTLESSVLNVWAEAAKKSESMDKVNPKALKKDFDDRKDKDIDNDGDVDDSDEYLHNRRKTVSKAVKKEEVDLDEVFNGTKQDVRKIARATDNALKKRSSQIQKMLKSKTNEKGRGLTDFEFDHISDEGDAIAAELVYRKKGGKGPISDDIPPHLKKFVNEEVDLDEDASNFKSAVARIKKAKSAKDLKKLEKSFERVYKQTDALTDKEFGQLDDMISDKLVKLGEEVDESYEIGTDEYRDHTLDTTPGQSLTWGTANAYKQASMKEALAKVWGLDEKVLDKSEESDTIAPVKGKKSMTGGKVADVDVDPEMKKEDK